MLWVRVQYVRLIIVEVEQIVFEAISCCSLGLQMYAQVGTCGNILWPQYCTSFLYKEGSIDGPLMWKAGREPGSRLHTSTTRLL